MCMKKTQEKNMSAHTHTHNVKYTDSTSICVTAMGDHARHFLLISRLCVRACVCVLCACV